jgi:hypothetical protein
MTVVAVDAVGAAVTGGGDGWEGRSGGLETGGGTEGEGECWGDGGGSGFPKKAKGYLPERKKSSIAPELALAVLLGGVERATGFEPATSSLGS